MITPQSFPWRVDYWQQGKWVHGSRFTSEERAVLHAQRLMTDKPALDDLPAFVGVEKTRISLRNKIQRVLKKESHYER